jgi:hypothetical protein
MSVIGRLDEQVNDLLISPLEKERRSKTDAEPEAPHIERANTQAQSIAQNRRRASDSDNESSEHVLSDRDELPVWLL